MTVYFKAGKGCRYDFMVKGRRHTKAAEAERNQGTKGNGSLGQHGLA